MGDPLFDLRGATAVVTGAARGIGFATASALARQGCAVTLTDVDVLAVEDAARQIGGAGPCG